MQTEKMDGHAVVGQCVPILKLPSSDDEMLLVRGNSIKIHVSQLSDDTDNICWPCNPNPSIHLQAAFHVLSVTQRQEIVVEMRDEWERHNKRQDERQDKR